MLLAPRQRKQPPPQAQAGFLRDCPLFKLLLSLAPPSPSSPFLLLLPSLSLSSLSPRLFFQFLGDITDRRELWLALWLLGAQHSLLPPAQLRCPLHPEKDRPGVASLHNSAQDRFYQLPLVTEFPKAITRALQCLQGVELRASELGYPAGNGGSGVYGQHKQRQCRPMHRDLPLSQCSAAGMLQREPSLGRRRHSRNTALQAKAPQFRWLLSSCALEEENNPHESRLVLMGCRMGHLYLRAGQGTVYCQWSPW